MTSLPYFSSSYILHIREVALKQQYAWVPVSACSSRLELLIFINHATFSWCTD